jgi:hypothetical protein
LSLVHHPPAVHDCTQVIIAASFRFWYPALMLMFGGPGVLFISMTRNFAARFANVFMWLMLSVGLALLTVLCECARRGGGGAFGVHMPACRARADSRELYSRYAWEWASLPGTIAGPPYVYNPLLHPSPDWGV